MPRNEIIIIILIILFIIQTIRFYANKSHIRRDAIKRSKAVRGGQVAEQVAPFLPNFPCNAEDVRFIGKPIDFIGFSGLSDGDEIEEILFIEVKTGQSALSKREKEIKKAVKSGKVRYVEYRV